MDIDVINVPGRNGEKYFLFFTDDFSGFHFGSAITSRSGQVILDYLMNILPYIERQTGNNLKAIRSGNALEFCSGIFPAKAATSQVGSSLTPNPTRDFFSGQKKSLYPTQLDFYESNICPDSTRTHQNHHKPDSTRFIWSKKIVDLTRLDSYIKKNLSTRNGG
jgi:hypothetical protein